MADAVRDRVFGDMEYKHSWSKMQDVSLHGKNWHVKITAFAYTGERICEEQRRGYRYFVKNIDIISKQCEDGILNYFQSHWSEIPGCNKESRELTVHNVIDFVTPRTILFTRDGEVVILYDVKWDEENGMGVEVYPDIRVGLQDEFL